MSEDARRQGLAARLLRSAEGRVTALRPQIASAFSIHSAAPEAPLLERTEEIPASAAASLHQTPGQLDAAPPHKFRPQSEPFRLMPSEPPHVRGANPLPDAAGPATDPDAKADAQVPTELPFQSAAAASSPWPFAERRADNLSAAVMQLLGPEVAETHAGAPTPEPRLAQDGLATTGVAVPGAPVPAAAMDVASAPTEQAKLQIHIGELVVAPEPRAPMREAPPPATWEPPLSLADYRASRSRDKG